MLKNVGVLLAGCAGLFASQLRADFVSTASLSAATDNATDSNGSGSAVVTYNSAADDFTYTLTWSNLTGPATMGHIHFGPPGVDGPIVIPFFMSNMPASDTISGTLTQSDVKPTGSILTIADVASAIEAGNGYVNIHTTQYPAGEIRGQLAVGATATPEPATVGMTLLALTATALVYRRRKGSSI